MRQNCGNAGIHVATARQCHLAHLYAFDIGDGVERAGLQNADDDACLSGAWPHLRLGVNRCGRQKQQKWQGAAH